MRILLLEDNPDDTEAFLRACGPDHEVIVCGTLRDFAQLSADCDAIVVDLSLPGGESPEHICRQAADSGKPIMALSGSPVEHQLRAARATPLVCAVDKNQGRAAIVAGIESLAARVAFQRAVQQRGP